ncbi:MAG: YHS domain-containing protein, partial [Chloroflexota bacterium]
NQMTQTFKDPTCGMDVTPETASGLSECKGQTYYFCSMGCKNTFDAEPERYLNKVSQHTHGCC